MICASFGSLGGPLGAVLGLLWGLLDRLGAILAVLTRSWAVLESSWAAWVCFLGRRGSFGEPQGGAMAAQGPPAIGAMQSGGCGPEGGALRRLQKPARPPLAFFHASTCPRHGGGLLSLRFALFCFALICIALHCLAFAFLSFVCNASRCIAPASGVHVNTLHCTAICAGSSPSTAFHCFALVCADVFLLAIRFCSVRVIYTPSPHGQTRCREILLSCEFVKRWGWLEPTRARTALH